jgi:RNA polymerase sigma-70 factor (ECF subfamily)
MMEAADPIDERAFQSIYQRTAGPLRAYAARVMGSIAPADDIVQETYLRLLRHPPPTRNPDEIRAYLFRVASNLLVDHWRRRKREAPAAEGPEPRTSERDAPLRLDMARTFRQLRPQERQLMWLAHVEGASHREIAGALGLREGSIRVLLSRARRKLGDLLRASGHGPEAR